MGEVELHENAAATRLLVRDALQTYAYGYETQAFNVIQTAPRIRVRWQYAPALGPAVAFRVYRQVGSAPFVKIAELPAVEPGVQIYTYLDGQIQPGVIYVYYVVAVTASGEESAATPPMAVEVPRSVQAPQSATAVYVAGT
jgi:hypothetical protein